MKNVIVTLLAAALLCGCKPEAKTFEELSPGEQLAALRIDAATAMQQSCSNDITGLRRIIAVYPDVSSDAIAKWKGYIDAEYINRAGGVERTNYHVVFLKSAESLSCVPDFAYYQHQYEQHLRRIESGQSD